MKRLVLITPLLLALAAGAATPPVSTSIVMHPGKYFAGWKTEIDGPSARFERELGDTFESVVVEVVPEPGDEREFAVQVQVETSMTIMDEGPHLDLVDWKHHISDWVDLERVDRRKFRMPDVDSDYEFASRFPEYTVDELYAVALVAGGSRWADIARQWPDRADGRVGVSISTVRLRVVTGDAEPPQTLFTVNIGIPMGC